MDGTESTPKITRNCLDSRKMRKLGDWLEKYPGKTADIKASDLAKEAAVALAFAVTTQNVRTAARAAGVEVQRRLPKVVSDPDLFELKDLKRRVEELERRVAELTPAPPA